MSQISPETETVPLPARMRDFIKSGITQFKEHELREIVAVFCRLPGIAPKPGVAPTPDLEPVAWQKRPTFGDHRVWSLVGPSIEDHDFWREQEYEIRPLYAASPDTSTDRTSDGR